eukprot:gnl/TRDRNA2_/TRDRNA2_35802_c0_seq1.p1 gnl/TRDRNA2_/TRDRNA2_35802_c0~~gnl/TRDRNA2_/TRDRNA2_35802_c0_seq1.p1  ORF type:complete len:452 (+),score=111.42 gnl/TRDRNA2_/TRDRNA2_35802_c0_seq1:28-1356(+)
MRAFITLALATLAAAVHYEKPPCSEDELQANLQGGGELCAPKCSSDGSCPTDVPTGTTASPVCALESQAGQKYCGLECKASSECPTDGHCSMVSPGTGICTYASDHVEDATPLSYVAPEPSTAEEKFEIFVARFGRSFSSKEEKLTRFKIFYDNLVTIAELQAHDPEATYSHMTPFADWTPEEFAARNQLKPDLLSSSASSMRRSDVLHNTSDLPTSWDWREKGAVNKVKNQGMCGSCWAFSTVANVEGVNFVKTKELLSLSEQELVDCDKVDQGCQGGLPSNAYEVMASKHLGLEQESVYPYAGFNEKCKAKSSDEKVFVSSYLNISSDEDQIAAALVKYGPLSIGINAGPMQFYFGGISHPWKILCSPKAIDHGVAIVGFGEKKGFFKTTKYWIIRNSWGEAWGEKGYYRIVRGTGACGLNTMVATAVIGSAESDATLVV